MAYIRPTNQQYIQSTKDTILKNGYQLIQSTEGVDIYTNDDIHLNIIDNRILVVTRDSVEMYRKSYKNVSGLKRNILNYVAEHGKLNRWGITKK